MNNFAEKSFKRNYDSLSDIFDFVSDYLKRFNIDEASSFKTNLAIEELFTNMIKYQTDGKHDIIIELMLEDNKLIINMTDQDVKRFDITKSPEVDINKPLNERKDGGLGLFLVKKIMDEVKYDYKNGNSRITIVKNLEN